ncbi:hypothetical protein JHK87_043220 [Glycine soja]|nr:hypothetical protein JHK87_043220 [Glycine soja]
MPQKDYLQRILTDLGTEEERAEVERVRKEYNKNRFKYKHSSDLLMRLQFEREKGLKMKLSKMENQSEEDITVELVETRLKRALRSLSILQAEDGFWPNDYSGPLFLLPGLPRSDSTASRFKPTLDPFSTFPSPSPSRSTIETSSPLPMTPSPTAAASGPQLPHWCHSVQYWRGCKEGLMESTIVTATRAMKGVKRANDVVEFEEVIGLSVIGALNEILTPEHQSEIRRYLFNHQNEDGGWGMHIEGSSIMFTSALNYVTLRLLGEDINGGEGAIQKARTWILDHGGATYIPSWGKLWLSEDMSHPSSMIQNILWDSFHSIGEPLLMHWPFSKLRQEALCHVMEHIHYEDENTNYICLAPISKNPNSQTFKRHIPRIKDYLWVAEDGMKMQAYGGSQLWDTVFSIQAILATNLKDEYGSMLKKANNFIKCSQITTNSSGTPSDWYRHISKGGWTFSTADNGWPVSDCTGEALKAAILLSNMSFDIVDRAMEVEQLYDGVNWILSMQVYTNLEGNKSNVVNTAWAMLALIEAGQEITGITNRTIATAPSAYRNIFPIWALGEYRSRVLLCPSKSKYGSNQLVKVGAEDGSNLHSFFDYYWQHMIELITCKIRNR